MTCPECQQPSDIMHELTPDQEAAKQIETEREKQLGERDKKDREANPQTAAEKIFAEKVDRVNREEAGLPPKKGKINSGRWRMLEEVKTEGVSDILYAMDVYGGVIVRSVIASDEAFSQSMVFLPGFEIVGDGIIRKM